MVDNLHKYDVSNFQATSHANMPTIFQSDNAWRLATPSRSAFSSLATHAIPIPPKLVRWFFFSPGTLDSHFHGLGQGMNAGINDTHNLGMHLLALVDID